MKFQTLSDIENYFYQELPEDSYIVHVSAVLDESAKEGYVMGFDVRDDCDVMIGSFVKRWKSYYI